MAAVSIAAPRPVRSAALRAMENILSPPISRSVSPAPSSSSSSSSRAKRRTPKPKPPAQRVVETAESPDFPPVQTPRSRPPSRTERRYACPFPDCDKAYFKPSRLAEHERTHTGERPHACTVCSQTYFRASHLAAHLRTHRNPEEKEYVCPREGCGKTFWTATHLHRHEEMHDTAEIHPCTACDLTFPKTHLLREHFAASHLPEGTKPFVCSHDGCGRSFSMKQQLKTHEKTHDPTRYMCSHPDHGEDMPSFPVWSALQAHIKDAHPPACPFPECDGRSFKSATRLRDHLKVHEQRTLDLEQQSESDKDMPAVIAEGLKPSRRKRRRSSHAREHTEDDPGTPRKLPRLLSGEAGKEWACGAPGCGKTYKTRFARDEHAQATHSRARHRCNTCGRAYRRPISLTRHLQQGWCGSGSKPPTPTPKTPKSPADTELLTGTASLPGGSLHRRWACPYISDSAVCQYRFTRVYDVRRHLASEHNVSVDDMGTREMLLADGQDGEDVV